MNAWIMKPMPFAVSSISSLAAGYAADALTNDYAGVVTKSAAGQGELRIVVDMGRAVAIDAVTLFGCTGAQPGWTFHLSGSDDANAAVNVVVVADAVPFLAGAAFPAHGRGVGFWQSEQPVGARRFWHIKVADIGAAAVTIARLCLGQRIHLDRNFAFGAGFGVRDLGNVDFSPAGVRVRRRAAKLRTVGLTFPAAYKDEVEKKIQPLVEQVAGQEPIVLVTDPAPHEHRQQRCYFGHLFGDLGTVWRSAAGWEWRANLIDLIPVPAGG